MSEDPTPVGHYSLIYFLKSFICIFPKTVNVFQVHLIDGSLMKTQR